MHIVTVAWVVLNQPFISCIQVGCPLQSNRMNCAKIGLKLCWLGRAISTPGHLDLSAMTVPLRQVVQAEFRRQQLMLDKEALQMIVDLVAQQEDSLEAVYAIIDKLDTGVCIAAVARCAVAVLTHDVFHVSFYRKPQ